MMSPTWNGAVQLDGQGLGQVVDHINQKRKTVSDAKQIIIFWIWRPFFLWVNLDWWTIQSKTKNV